MHGSDCSLQYYNIKYKHKKEHLVDIIFKGSVIDTIIDILSYKVI